MAGSFPKDPSRLLTLVSGSRPTYALLASSDSVTTFDRQWFIETQGDEHGYSIGVIGSLTPDDWYNLTDIVNRLFVDGSSSVAVLESSVDGQWNGEVNVTVQVEGYGDVVLNWNSATAYVLIDPVFTAYVIANVGNTLGVNILPSPPAESAWFDGDTWVDSDTWID